jgi:hypothetical protein
MTTFKPLILYLHEINTITIKSLFEMYISKMFIEIHRDNCTIIFSKEQVPILYDKLNSEFQNIEAKIDICNLEFLETITKIIATMSPTLDTFGNIVIELIKAQNVLLSQALSLSFSQVIMDIRIYNVEHIALGANMTNGSTVNLITLKKKIKEKNQQELCHLLKVFKSQMKQLFDL